MSFAWLKNYMPRGLYGRTALILVVPIVVLQLTVSIVFIRNHLRDVTTQMTLTVVRELQLIQEQAGQSTDWTSAQIALGQTLEVLQMSLRQVPEGDDAAADRMQWYDYSARIVRRTIQRAMGPQTVVVFPDDRNVQIYLESAHGPLDVIFNRRRVTAAAPHQLIVTMVFFSALMTVIAFLYMRNQLRPITRLASAAQAFGRGNIVPYSPAGAIEVRAAGGAFLDMRARIERQIEQRTMMLSGVSHDLRTPLTRMKLGLALLEDEDARPLLQDVDEMQGLLDAFLEFARDAAESDPEKMDPQALVAQIVDNAQRAGRDVTLVEQQGQGDVMLRPVSMRRAVENLVGNAVRYGNRAEVSVVLTDKSLRIRVEDDGPGIPTNQRAQAVKPFSRLDPSRNQNKGSGVGLGLAIVNDAARAHGGVLRLGQSDRLGGLRADIVIAR